jgi:hypothetical protein
MTNIPSLDELWESTPLREQKFEPSQFATLPETARRYLEHAIAPGTALASAVHLQMHGEIKLKGWVPFTAEQVIQRNRGMIWRATARMNGLPIRGFDRVLDGEGEMRWKLLGVIPVMVANGPDITRSATGRVEAESTWLPSLFCGDDISWTAVDANHVHASHTMNGETTELELTVSDRGQLQSIKHKRWGDPNNSGFRYEDFGALVENEGTFEGYTIPTQLRVGWYFGSDRFDAEGEFFRVTVDDAKFR